MVNLKNKNIFALICARAGSKGLSNKNIKMFNGKPLIAHSIEVAKSCEVINRIFVSTDGSNIAEIAREYGAEVPYMRSAHLSEDDSPEWFVWRDMIRYFLKKDSMPEAIVILPPTAPLRHVSDVYCAIERFFNNDCDGVLCGSTASRNPEFNMVKIDHSGFCELAITPKKPHHRRQEAPEYFDLNTVCYVMNPRFVLRAKSLFFGRILLQPVPVERSVDIDTQLDFDWAEFLFGKRLN